MKLSKYKDFFKKTNLLDVDKDDFTQEELDNRLDEFIRKDNYYEFCDIIKKGADINKWTKNYKFTNYFAPDGTVQSQINPNDFYYTTPLIFCIMLGEVKFIKFLVDRGVDLINQPEDIYDYIIKMFGAEDGKKVINYIIKKRPSFMSDRESKLTANKYNI